MADEEMLTCPFDPIHIVVRHRMPYHIVKCKQNYRGITLIPCHFNAMHWIEPLKMKEHLQDCAAYRIATMDEQRKRNDEITREIIERRTGMSKSAFSKLHSKANSGKPSNN